MSLKDKLLVREYLFVYVIMLFTEQEHIKTPKSANLTNWNTLYSNTENYNEVFLFATNVVLLKRIFINIFRK